MQYTQQSRINLILTCKSCSSQGKSTDLVQDSQLPEESESDIVSESEDSRYEPPDISSFVGLSSRTTVFQSVPKAISLCGAETLSEVKNLLQEWIYSTNGTCQKFSKQRISE